MGYLERRYNILIDVLKRRYGASIVLDILGEVDRIEKKKDD